jgi:hypothetical protein
MKPTKATSVIRQSLRIEGWFEDEAAMLFAWVDEIQKKHGITGDLFEIGTHHGRSAVFLAAMADAAREKLGLCDLFGDQEANTSASGSGDLHVLHKNLSRSRDAGLQVTIHQRNSTSLAAAEIGGPFRFFHIDGGHNCEEALSDLRLAAESLLPMGVIALDDPFQSGWPGVTEAMIRFLDEYDYYCAIVVGYNKLLLTRREFAGLYQEEFRRQEKRQEYRIGVPWEMKELPFHGYPLQIFYLSAYLQAHRLTFLVRKYYRSHDWLKNPVFLPIVALVRKLVQKREPK